MLMLKVILLLATSHTIAFFIGFMVADDIATNDIKELFDTDDKE